MAIKLKSTKDLVVNSVKLLVYGQAGAGKTYLIKTLPNAIILSAEAGLLSIKEEELHYIEITSIDDFKEAYQWVISSDEAKIYESIALDSISEIAEVLLGEEKKQTNDPRKAYGAMQDQMMEVIRSFRDVPGKHVYFSAKLEKSQDEMGKMMYNPSMPGKTLAQQIPYFFDEVFALRVERDEAGGTHRALMCDTDGLWLAKDRSGKLSQWEDINLSSIINKISGVVKNEN